MVIYGIRSLALGHGRARGSGPQVLRRNRCLGARSLPPWIPVRPLSRDTYTYGHIQKLLV